MDYNVRDFFQDFFQRVRVMVELERLKIGISEVKWLNRSGNTFRIFRSPTESDDLMGYDERRAGTIVKGAEILYNLISYVRYIPEAIGLLKVELPGEKKPEKSSIWKGMIDRIDRLFGIEPKEKNRKFTRVIGAASIMIPIMIAPIVVLLAVTQPKQAPEKKLPEKVAPAPRKAIAMEVHRNDVFYRMAFASTPKTFVVAAPPTYHKKSVANMRS